MGQDVIQQKLNGQVCPIAKQCWYNRESDCWRQLWAVRYRPA